jgi:hypothetical protein
VSILPCQKMGCKLNGDRVSTTQVDLFLRATSSQHSRSALRTHDGANSTTHWTSVRSLVQANYLTP